jgi:hypothetical protein
LLAREVFTGDRHDSMMSGDRRTLPELVGDQRALLPFEAGVFVAASGRGIVFFAVSGAG